MKEPRGVFKFQASMAKHGLLVAGHETNTTAIIEIPLARPSRSTALDIFPEDDLSRR